MFGLIAGETLANHKSLTFLSRLASHDYEKGIELFNHLMLADIFFPLFYFLISLNYIKSFKRHSKNSKKEGYKYLFNRYFVFIGIGYIGKLLQEITSSKSRRILWQVAYPLLFITIILLIITIISYFRKKESFNKFKKCTELLLVLLGVVNICGTLYYHVFNIVEGESVKSAWNTLQSIGLTGLFMIPFVETSTLFRAISSIVIFVIYALIHNINGMPAYIDIDAQGGILGSIGWLCFVLVYSCLSDLYYKDKENNTKMFHIGTFVCILISIVFMRTFVVDKNYVSPGYIIVSLCIPPLIFEIVRIFKNIKYKFDFLKIWGYKPLVSYLLNFFFGDVVYAILPFLEDVNKLGAIIYTLIVIVLVTIINYFIVEKNEEYSLDK